MKFRVLLLSLASLAPIPALCDEAPPPENVWTGKGQAGYVASQGNSEAKSANAAIDMALLEGPWKHAFHLGGLYGQSAGITSAERWDALWQSNYSFSKELFGFGNLRYAHDLFSGFQYQATGSVGAGYKFIDDATTKLDAQLGVGYRRLRPELITKNAAGAVIARTLQDSQSGAVLTGGFNYSDALTDTTTLSNKFLFETG
jgi:putative salt-induced outer membrane protein